MGFFTAYTLKENERGCANLKKTMQPTKQEQWQTAAVTSQRKQLDISSDSQGNIWWQFSIQTQRYKLPWQRNKRTRKEWQERVSQRWTFSQLLPLLDPQVPKRASHLRESWSRPKVSDTKRTWRSALDLSCQRSCYFDFAALETMSEKNR